MHWLLITVLVGSTWHPMYLSTCQIGIGQDRSWTASWRIFHDDLEDALQHQTGQRPTLNESTLIQHQGHILEYLSQHFLVESTEGTRLEFGIMQLSMEGDVITVMCEGYKPWSKSKHFITNDLLTEIFGSQKNVMTIHSQGEIETLYFTKGQNQHTTDI